MALQIVVCDFETFHTDALDAREIPYKFKQRGSAGCDTEDYVRHPWFDPLGAAFKWTPGVAARWYSKHELQHIIKEHDWSTTWLICHHSQFDAFILSHHFNAHPARISCTLSMFRLLYGTYISASLDNVRKTFNMPAKTTPYGLFKGKHWEELTPQVQALVAEGCEDETESIWKIFCLLAKDFPLEEYEVLDITLKMFTEPVLGADTALLAKVWEAEALNKQKRLATLNVAATELASADKFTALLEAEGIEIEFKAGKKKAIPCFAKTDDFMRNLLEHPNDRVRTLAEARLGEKSTFLQTRAETLGWRASRGALPVYLSYAGAGTLRPTGGDSDNWLNFKRGSDIRKSILAPDGYLLAPVDSSQIECRCLHYLAGGPDEPVIQQFRNRQDPYVDLATKFYREPIYKPKDDDPRKDEMEAKRGMGKQGRLMCLAAETLVLTDSGPKAIVSVKLTDRLWDGIEWVNHQGLLKRGLNTVIQRVGLLSTPEHPVLCGDTWQPMHLLQNEATLFQALATGRENWSSRDIKLESAAASSRSWFGVHALRQSIQWIRTIFSPGEQHAATLAPKKLPDIGLKNITAISMCAQTNHTDAAYWAASEPYTLDVNQKTAILMKITGGAVSKFADNGKIIAALSLPIWSRFQVGMIQIWKSIESTIKKVTDQETSALLRSEQMCKINGDFETWSKKLPTYDISFAGPRNRFTILSAYGPLIVHNCGYGASGKQFKTTAKNGLYGPSVDISLEDSNAFVALYRSDNPSVCARNTGYWAQAERMIARLAGGGPVDWGPLHVRDGKIYLPNNCPLVYSMEYHKPDGDEEVRDFERDGYWRTRTKRGWKKMWGSKLTQNICEAVSRVIVTQAAIRISRMGYRILNHPYDELLCLIPKDGKEEWHLERCKTEMVREVSWLPGLPLDCEAKLNERYMK